MNEHLGSCLCETVSFAIKGEFDSFYLCRCHRLPKFFQPAKLIGILS